MARSPRRSSPSRRLALREDRTRLLQPQKRTDAPPELVPRHVRRRVRARVSRSAVGRQGNSRNAHCNAGWRSRRLLGRRIETLPPTFENSIGRRIKVNQSRQF